MSSLSRAFGGNQLAVFSDAAGVSDAEMQVLAHELEFQRIDFVTASDVPGAVRRVKDFHTGAGIPMRPSDCRHTWVLASHGQIPLKPARGSLMQFAARESGGDVTIEARTRRPESCG